ncbi:MAG: Ig-like domain-containing protein [Rhodocyclaceae bacterium]|nr:Ig-like domain-containing protein [Rhodocyclaceae bacterium]
MFKAIFSRLAITLLATGLVACGGGGGGGDTCIGCPLDDGTPTATGTTLTLIVSSPTLATDGADRVTVRATVKDASNAAVPDQEVRFSADSGTLSAPSAVTDAQGVAEVEFNSDDNKANRPARIEAFHGSLSADTEISVSGTTLSFGGDLAGVIGQSVNMVVSLADAGGAVIANSAISLSSQLGNPVPASVTTNAQGQAAFSFVPTIGGSEPDVISASALGARSSQAVSISSVNFRFDSPTSGSTIPVSSAGGCQLVVLSLSGFSATELTVTNPRGTVHPDNACAQGNSPSLTVPLSNGTASAYVKAPSAGNANLLATATDGTTNASTTTTVSFIAVLPASVSIQGTPTTVAPTGSSNITALVKDAEGNPVAGKTVTFSAPNGGGSPSPAQAITDEAGRALTVFTADPSISGKDSVILSALVVGTSVSGQTELTVAGNAVNIVIGTDNTISAIEPVSFRKRFVALVGDTAGNPVPNQTVTISLNFGNFRKGFYEVVTGAQPPWRQVVMDTCGPEEPNNNGIVDDAEIGDIDGDGVFEPNGAAIVRPIDGASGGSTVTIVTDDAGASEFWVEYPRNYATWAQVVIVATAVVAGNNSVASSTMYVPVSADELSDESIAPSPVISPFGVNAGCTDPS